MYATWFAKIPVVKYCRSKAASEGSKTVSADLAAAGIQRQVRHSSGIFSIIVVKFVFPLIYLKPWKFWNFGRMETLIDWAPNNFCFKTWIMSLVYILHMFWHWQSSQDLSMRIPEHTGWDHGEHRRQKLISLLQLNVTLLNYNPILLRSSSICKLISYALLLYAYHVCCLLQRIVYSLRSCFTNSVLGTHWFWLLFTMYGISYLNTFLLYAGSN